MCDKLDQYNYLMSPAALATLEYIASDMFLGESSKAAFVTKGRTSSASASSSKGKRKAAVLVDEAADSVGWAFF